MANRTFHAAKSLDREVISLFGVLTIGAVGAISSQDCLGFSVARTGVGAWTITLGDRYGALFGINSSLLHATTPSGAKLELVADNSAAAAKTITAKWVNDAAVAGTFAPVDPASGSKVYLQILLRNSTVARKGL
jgi:hypothetical protein